MSKTLNPSLFSRLLLVVAGLLVIVLTYWLIATLLAPASAPPSPGSRGSVSFDPKLDVSRNELFFRMRPLGPIDPMIPVTGRSNPFIAPTPVVIPTSTTPTTSVPLIPSPATTTPEGLPQ